MSPDEDLLLSGLSTPKPKQDAPSKKGKGIICPPPITSLQACFKARFIQVVQIATRCGVGFRVFGGKLQTLICLITCRGFTTSVAVSCGAVKSVARYYNQLAKSTTVSNTGNNPATIYENGFIVGIAQPHESFKVPMSGRFEIEAQSSLGTTLVIQTEARCICNRPGKYYGAMEPVGGVLLI